MSDRHNGRIVQTVDLGPEQLQIIEESDQRVRVRGVWLREDAGRLAESWPSDGLGEGSGVSTRSGPCGAISTLIRSWCSSTPSSNGLPGIQPT